NGGVTQRGYARRLAWTTVLPQKRDGTGQAGFRINDQTGALVGALEVLEDEELMVLTPGGSMASLRVADAPSGAAGEPLQKVVTMPGGARIVDVTRMGARSRSEAPADAIASSEFAASGALASVGAARSAGGASSDETGSTSDSLPGTGGSANVGEASGEME